MRTWKRISAGVLAALALFSLVPAPRARAADTATAAGSGVRITQKAAWDTSVPGGTAVNVSIKITSDMDLQKPKDVVFVVDCSALQDLNSWKANARKLADYLRTVRGMRAALISYESTPTKVLDFTTDFDALKTRIDGLQKGVNSDAYAALRLAETVISSRSGARNPACIALFSNGRFNMNHDKTLSYGRELQARIPLYCPVSSGYSSAQGELSAISGGHVLTPYEAALEIGESRVCPVVITEQMDSGFLIRSASIRIGSKKAGTAALNEAAGTARGTVDLTMGLEAVMTVSAELRDITRMGDLPVASSAVVSVKGQTLTAGAVSLQRDGYRVTYRPNGGTGTVPSDSTVYPGGSTVSLKPAALRRVGWNFSGWTHPTTGIRNGSFTINGDTTLDAAWGRGYVKLSSSNITGPTGTDMMSRDAIEARSDQGFYNPDYWGYLYSITFLSTEQTPVVPNDCVANWDITDTTQSQPGSVMAWLKNSDYVTSSKHKTYDLFIAGMGGVIAPVDCSALFYYYYSTGSTNPNNLRSINGLEHLYTYKTTNMASMFSGCRLVSSKLNVGGWDTSKVTRMDSMFKYCLVRELDVSRWNVSNVTSMGGMFYDCALRSLDVKNWNVSKAQSMNEMFYSCSFLPDLNVSNWNTSSVINMYKMFDGCSELTELDVSKWDVSKVQDMQAMFRNCSQLESLSVEQWTTDSLNRPALMFKNCSAIKTLDLSRWNTSGFSRTSLGEMFSGCTSLTSLNLAGWTTKDVENTNNLFYNCSALASLDLTDWDTSSVTDMSGMFQNCQVLSFEALAPIINGWNVRKVKTMANMFNNCKALTSLDVKEWYVYSSLSDIDCIFKDCENLTDIGVTEWSLPKDTRYENWRTGANAKMDEIVLYVGGQPATVYPTGNAASLSGISEEEPVLLQDSVPVTGPEEDPVPAVDPEEDPAPVVDPEQNPAPAVDPEEDPAPAVDPEIPAAPAGEQAEAELPDDAPGSIKLDSDGRPVYARDKIGLWDLGEVRPGQKIDYTLQLQYLGEEVDQYGGVSGLMTVTNPIPAGLTLLDTPRIGPNPGWIDTNRGGTPEGRIVQEPKVENGVLTFSVTGLSMGAQYTVSYSCTAPETAPEHYIEFLNTASVDDNGLPDEADPVRHYMLAEDGTLPAYHQVTYAYDDTAPAGAPSYGEARYAAGTSITLPQPALTGYQFNGWRINGEGDTVTPHTVNSDVHFIGSWTPVEIPTVRIDYKFTTPAPENAGAIQNALLADAVTVAPENTVTSAPVLASPPAGWRLEWQYPETLQVAADGSFSVGRRADWPGGTIHITGKWIPEEFTVEYTYASPGPSDPPALPKKDTHPCGTSVTLAPNAANTDGYIFVGWSLPDGISLGENGTFTMPAENVTITGSWMLKPRDQEVLVDPNGGFWQDSPLQQVLGLSEYTEMTTNHTFPDPVNAGYTFDNWEITQDPAGSFAHIVKAIWKEPDTPVATCTLTFDSQGGTTVEEPVRTVEKNSLAAKPEDPVRGGYVFQGWSRTPNGTDRWNFAEDRVPGTMTLYAVWAEQTYKITGQVVDENNKPIPGARVEIVHAGHRVFQKTETDADGKYIIEKVPNGVYNTVATYQRDGAEVTTTVLSVISGENLENQTIRFASGNTNSHLKVDHMPSDTPYVVVGGLMVESGAVRENEKDADSVEVRMEVSPTDRAQKREDVAKLQTAAEEAVKEAVASGHRTILDLVLDFDLSQTVKPAGGAETTQKITETSAGNILRIVIPYPTEGKANILVHRCHGGEAVTFKKLTVLPKEQEPLTDGTFYLDTSANLIYVFASRFSVYAVSYTAPPATTPPVTPPSGGGGGGTSYLITATAGPGGTIQPEGKIRVSSGGSRTFTIRPAAGCTVREVLVDGQSVGAVSTYTFSNIRSNHTIEAFFDTDTGGLFREDHIDYLHGFRDGLFRPGAPMTRGQTAQMFYNLLRDRETGGESHFSDVPESMWCYEAVSALKTLGIMVGVTADRFEPDRPITRGELVVTATRFTEHDPAGPSPFSDVADTDWYASQISAAAARGWIGGYGDGTFRPNAPITRAQAARVINRLLNRAGDEAFIGSAPAGLRTFPDVAESYWAYLDIEESANAHDYRIHGAGETWTALR